MHYLFSYQTIGRELLMEPRSTNQPTFDHFIFFPLANVPRQHVRHENNQINERSAKHACLGFLKKKHACLGA